MKKIALILFLLAFIFIAAGCGNGSPWIWLGSSDDDTEPYTNNDKPHTDNDNDNNDDAGELNGDDAYIDRDLDERLFGIWKTDLSDTGEFFDVDLSMWESTFEFREDGVALTSTGPTEFFFTSSWYVDGEILYMRAFSRAIGGGRNYNPDFDRVYDVTWISDDNISIHRHHSDSVLVLFRVSD